jgi:glutamate carboxypeptidase
MQAIREFCRDQASWARGTLEHLVRLESPTDDKAAVDRCGFALRDLMVAAGARVTVIPQHTAGDHLRAAFGTGPKQLLVLGHFDTVWPVGQLDVMPLTERGGRLRGPGVFDMKGGLVIGLLALRALFERGTPPPAQVVFLLTSDEETGSATSRGLIEDEARRSDAVLVLEPALPGGIVKTARKGVGEFTLQVQGVAAHAGADITRGASAIVELARQILALQELQDPVRGLTLNVGVIKGGSRPNVVPESASAEIDVRIASAGDAARIESAIRALTPLTPNTRLSVTGQINRLPLERTPGVVRLYEIVRSVGAELGLEIREGSTGGASDGNFTAGLGVPTIDGLGATGDSAHALDEHVLIDELPDRAAIVAGTIERIAAGG